MKVFLTGATGYIGSAVLDALLRGGHQVVGLVRDPEKKERIAQRGASAVLGELATPKTYLRAVEDCDAVVHAAFEGSTRGVEKDMQALDTILPVLQARAQSRERAFVYTSGVWALGKVSWPADEDAKLNPIPHVSWRPAHEQRVLEAAGDGLRTIVIRSGIVYGGSRGIISEFLKDALNGLVRVIGSGKNCWACVYDRDVADLYARVLQEPTASGVYHANDEADERVIDIVEAIANHLTQRPDVRNVPLAEAKKKLGTYAEGLALDQRVRSARAHALGWNPSLRSVSGNVARLFEEFRARR